MEFITDNYVWFIVGGIILLMTIIGYVADKTDFGKQKFNSKPREEKPKTEKKVKEKKNNDLPKQKNKINEVEEILPLEIEVPKEETNAQIVNEDLNAPFGDSEELKPVEPIVLDEDLNIPLESVVSDSNENNQTKENDLPLPEIDTLGDKIEDEDVWKF